MVSAPLDLLPVIGMERSALRARLLQATVGVTFALTGVVKGAVALAVSEEAAEGEECDGKPR